MKRHLVEDSPRSVSTSGLQDILLHTIAEAVKDGKSLMLGRLAGRGEGSALSGSRGQTEGTCAERSDDDTSTTIKCRQS